MLFAGAGAAAGVLVSAMLVVVVEQTIVTFCRDLQGNGKKNDDLQNWSYEAAGIAGLGEAYIFNPTFGDLRREKG